MNWIEDGRICGEEELLGPIMSRSEISIPIPTRLFLDVVEFLRGRNSDRDPVDAIHSAIEFWMRSTGAEQTATVTPASDTVETQILPALEGYWWKGVYIPSGSKARMIYKGRTYIADVTSNGFVLDGKTHSPSELTWAITSTARNAWRDIEIQFPDRIGWTLADDLRKQNRK